MEQMKEELTKLINNTIKFFVGKKYIKNQAQNWVNEISDQIILNISAKKIPNYKFVCSTTIIKKGNSSLNFSTTCLWHPADDKTLTIKYENNILYCFVPEDNKGEPPPNLNNNKNNISQKKRNLYSPNFKEKKINNKTSKNNLNNKPNENFERKSKRSNSQNVINNMNMNINPMFLGINMNFPQIASNGMLMNRMNMRQFNFSNLNMIMNPMFMNNNKFPMGMNRMNYRPMNMNMNPMPMNNVQKRNNKFILPPIMIAQNNNFNAVNNLNNIKKVLIKIIIIYLIKI